MYSVDNAIILAAGMATRCKPYSEKIPKGLFRVRGEILLERQIKQLLEKGIKDIIVVTGYLSNQFEYLKELFGVKLIYNDEYMQTNNISSIWAARQYLANTYILGSDNWYQKNIFQNECEESFFSCVFSKGFSDEYCVKVENDIIVDIKKGGTNCWYTLGDIFFNEKLSKKIIDMLDLEYGKGAEKMIIDDYCIKHMDSLRFVAKKRPPDTIYEFDSVDEFIAFDNEFLIENGFHD